MIEIYGKTQCPYCDMAKQLCQQEKLDYNYSQLDVDFTREQLFEEFPTARTFPQIRIDGEAIGGFDNLQEWHNNRKLLVE